MTALTKITPYFRVSDTKKASGKAGGFNGRQASCNENALKKWQKKRGETTGFTNFAFAAYAIFFNKQKKKNIWYRVGLSAKSHTNARARKA